jgi:hypothetical protein
MLKTQLVSLITVDNIFIDHNAIAAVAQGKHLATNSSGQSQA